MNGVKSFLLKDFPFSEINYTGSSQTQRSLAKTSSPTKLPVLSTMEYFSKIAIVIIQHAICLHVNRIVLLSFYCP